MNNYYRRSNRYANAVRNNVYQYDKYSCPDNCATAIELIEEGAADEKRAERLYDYLISIAPSEEDKQILRTIRDDERSHYNLLRRLYYELTCSELPEPVLGEFAEPETYCQGLKTALKNELEAVKKYRQILYAMCHRTHMNIMTEIITDELRHADYINFLYSKNECYEEEIGEKEENAEGCRR